MSSEKFEEKKFPILELPNNIGICTNIAHTKSFHPSLYGQTTGATARKCTETARLGKVEVEVGKAGVGLAKSNKQVETNLHQMKYNMTKYNLIK